MNEGEVVCAPSGPRAGRRAAEPATIGKMVAMRRRRIAKGYIPGMSGQEMPAFDRAPDCARLP